jgi:hypothetical protein
MKPSEIHGNEASQMREEVKCVGALHSIVFWRLVLIILLPLWFVLPLLQFICIVPMVLLVAWLNWKRTVIIVTDLHVTIRRGPCRMTQMSIAQVESVDVIRSYLGMMFNYGTIVIYGAGGRAERVNTIADPLRLQRWCG